MSTEPDSQVKEDESGIVPQQSERGPEWPKKIRTLTATELDRLTIDSSGRFYWDGRLVNYEPPTAKSDKAPDHGKSTADLDRDPYGFDDAKSTESDADAEHGEGQIHPVAHREDRFHDFDDVRTVSHRVVQHHGDASDMSDAYAVPSIQLPDRVRLSMTAWQSLAAIIVVLCFMVGTLGVAAFGFIAAHDWGCRTGLIESHCAAGPGARPSSRSDIPA
jgi:hypothetical protein